jgi:hypothetical protein
MKTKALCPAGFIEHVESVLEAFGSFLVNNVLLDGKGSGPTHPVGYHSTEQCIGAGVLSTGVNHPFCPSVCVCVILCLGLDIKS